MSKVIEKKCVTHVTAELPEKFALSPYYSPENLRFCRHILQAQLSGHIVLPHGLGLSTTNYQMLREALNDKDLIYKEIEWHKENWSGIRERAEFCAQMFAMKSDECDELTTLLLSYRNQQTPSSKQMAVIVATASLSQFHLWESLGLPDRALLGSLIQHNFPKLHALNTENMRWKRFFYRQLCEQGGDYICKAPNCQECQSYKQCFAEQGT